MDAVSTTSPLLHVSVVFPRYVLAYYVRSSEFAIFLLPSPLGGFAYSTASTASTLSFSAPAGDKN